MGSAFFEAIELGLSRVGAQLSPKAPTLKKTETIVTIVSPHSRNLIVAVQYTTKPNSTLRTPQQTSSNFQSRPYPERKPHTTRLNSQASETPRTSAAKIRAAARSKLSRPLVSGSSKLSQMLIHFSRCASMPPFGGQSLCVLEPGVCMSYGFPHRNPHFTPPSPVSHRLHSSRSSLAASSFTNSQLCVGSLSRHGISRHPGQVTSTKHAETAHFRPPALCLHWAISVPRGWHPNSSRMQEGPEVSLC